MAGESSVISLTGTGGRVVIRIIFVYYVVFTIGKPVSERGAFGWWFELIGVEGSEERRVARNNGSTSGSNRRVMSSGIHVIKIWIRCVRQRSNVYRNSMSCDVVVESYYSANT